jgi:osmotically inducible protein OsmC
MKKSKANAVWKGTIKNGTGTIKLSTAGQEMDYTFASRFENGSGTNPEELIAAAHAGCFSMALSAELTEKGYNPESINTSAEVSVEKSDDGFRIAESTLTVEAKVPDIDETLFMKLAVHAKNNCPVSQALASVRINLHANLIQ